MLLETVIYGSTYKSFKHVFVNIKFLKSVTPKYGFHTF